MSFTKRVAGLAWIYVLAATAMVVADVVSVDLALTPPDPMNVLEITLAADVSGSEFSDSDTTTATGNLLTELTVEFDPETHRAARVDGIEFVGGAFTLSDTDFRLNFGFLLGAINASGAGISGTVTTPNPPGPVIGGELSTLDHLVILDQGVFEATGTGIVGAMLPESPFVVDLSAEPIEATTDATGQIAVSPPVIDGDEATYEVILTLPVNFNEAVFEVPGPPIAAALDVIGTGTLEAVGSFTRPLPAPMPLTWDGLGDGRWDSSTQWTGGDPGQIPSTAVGATVLDDAVTVGSEAAALSLSIDDQGAVILADGGMLTVVENIKVGAGSLDMTATGALSVGGGMTLSGDSELRFELRGPRNSHITAGGDVRLDGALVVEAMASLRSENSPMWFDESRTLITAAGDVGGTFAAQPSVGDHLGYGVFSGDVTYGAQAVELNLFQAAPGDIDGDRQINNRDLQLILAANSFLAGTGFGWTEGDFDGDTDVDNGDLQLILATGLFGSGNYAALAAVPEPGMLVLMVTAGAGLFWWRRRRG